jgi:Leucine-rich repeat (LRR) protein
MDRLPNEIIEKICSFIRCINDIPDIEFFHDIIEFLKTSKQTTIIKEFKDFSVLDDKKFCFICSELYEKKIINNEYPYDALTLLSESVGYLKNLKELNLNRNEILVLPENFCNLKNLEVLKITHNKLIKLPENIDGLQNLKKLYLDYNDISYLPENFCSLKNLQILSICNNKLSKLPNNLKNLKNLEEIYLDNNLLLESDVIKELEGLENQLKDLSF